MSQNLLSSTIWEFLLLLLLVPVLASLFLNTFIELFQHGVLAIWIVLIVTSLICLLFRSTAARMAAAFVIFCWLCSHGPTLANSYWPYLGLALLIVGAYFVRQARLEHKFQPPKLHGVERKPVMPAAEEQE